MRTSMVSLTLTHVWIILKGVDYSENVHFPQKKMIIF